MLLHLEGIGVEVTAAKDCLLHLVDVAGEGDVTRAAEFATHFTTALEVGLDVAGALQEDDGLLDAVVEDVQVARAYEFDVRGLGFHMRHLDVAGAYERGVDMVADDVLERHIA